MKINIILGIALIVLLVTPMVFSEGEIWTFSNFLNKYKVYGSATCDVQGIKPCPNELSWQGNSIKFKFKLSSTEELTEMVLFRFNVDYYTNYGKPDAILNIKVGKFIKTITVNGQGVYDTEIPKSYFKAGTNKIQMKGTNIKVGYGRHPPTLVLDYVSLENLYAPA